MVLIKIKFNQILRILEVCGTFTSTWPPAFTAGKREIFLRELGWTLAILNVLMSIGPLILGAWHYDNDVVRLMTALSEVMALTEVLFNLILCRIKRLQLQKILVKLKDFFEHSRSHEKRILQKYINRYSDFSIIVGTSYIIAAIIFSCGPLFMSIDLPMEVWYPFSTDAPYIKSILYVHQVFAILQTGFCITVDFMIAMFFWYTTARLDMLAQELQQSKHEDKMKLCFRKHQEIISFTDEVQCAVRYLISKTNITMAATVICGVFPMTYKQSMTVMAQFIIMVVAACQRLYVTAWPADDLAETSQQIIWAAYNTSWYKTSRETASNIQFFIQRSMKPLLISMGGMFPTLSLQYYVNFLKAISSYCMTMKAVIAD